MRFSELTGLKVGDVHLGTALHAACRGKGRINRTTPLDAGTVAVLKTHLAETGAGPAELVFPTRTGTRMSRDAVEARLSKNVAAAATMCPSLTGKSVTPIRSATQRHETAARRHRRHRYRYLARPRKHRNHISTCMLT
jgi:integrase/recombinase XerD